MNEVSLRQLEYLVAVAEEGTISAGAARSRVSAVAVGQALDELERRLGVTLIERRRSKGTEVTALGDVVVAQARHILHSVNLVPLMIDAHTQRMKKSLSIGAFPTLAAWSMVPLVSYFSAHFPEMEITLREADYAELHQGLMDGTIDIAVCWGNHVLPGVRKIPVATVAMRILVSSTHSFARLESVDISQLKEENLVINDLHPVSEKLAELLGRAGVGDSIRWRTTSTDVIKNLVGRNLAVCPLFSPGLGLTSNEGQPLAVVPLVDPLVQDVVVCIKEDVPLGPAHEVVVSQLREHARAGLEP